MKFGGEMFEQMNNRYIFRAMVVLSCLLAIAGCSPKSAPKPAAEKRYHLEGKVVAIDKELHRVTVDHKDIPGFMSGMTMSYKVAADVALDKLSVGDSITATVVVSDSKVWLEDVRVLKQGTGSSTKRARLAADTSG